MWLLRLPAILWLELLGWRLCCGDCPQCGDREHCYCANCPRCGLDPRSA